MVLAVIARVPLYAAENQRPRSDLKGQFLELILLFRSSLLSHQYFVKIVSKFPPVSAGFLVSGNLERKFSTNIV